MVGLVAFTQKSAKIDSVGSILLTTDLIVVRDVCWGRGGGWCSDIHAIC